MKEVCALAVTKEACATQASTLKDESSVTFSALTAVVAANFLPSLVSEKYGLCEISLCHFPHTSTVAALFHLY